MVNKVLNPPGDCVKNVRCPPKECMQFRVIFQETHQLSPHPPNASLSPGIFILQLPILPVPPSVMKAVRRSAPPKQILDGRGSGLPMFSSMYSSISPAGEYPVIPPDAFGSRPFRIMVAIYRLPWESTAIESGWPPPGKSPGSK